MPSTTNTLIQASSAKTLNEIMSFGFVVSRFSTEETIIMVSKDHTAKVIIENGKARVYSTTNNKVHYNEVSALSAIALN